MPEYLLTMTPHLLEEVSFVGSCSTIDAVCSFMRVRSLKRLNVRKIDPRTSLSHVPKNVQNAMLQGAKLNRLDLGIVHIPPPKLRELLSFADSVSELYCAMPGVEEPFGSMSLRPLQTNMDRPLSPASMSNAFLPSQDCLVELRLNDGALSTWPGHDKTRLNVSQFACLQVLETPSSCFFDQTTFQSRKGIQKLLPCSLKMFKVCSPPIS